MRTTEKGEFKFYESYQMAVTRGTSLKIGSTDRELFKLLASLSQGLGAVSIAIREVYDKLVEMDRKLSKR